jgi:putative peptide zinc metalloprotease protein
MVVNTEALTLRGGRRQGAPSTGSVRSTQAPAVPPPPPGVVVPARAAGVELLGAFERSGHRDAPYLVRRADGQMVQLTPLLHQVLDAIDGGRRYNDLADVVSARINKLVTPEEIRFLIEEKLRPLGLLRGLDGAEPVTKRANPLLALRFRATVTNPRVTGAIAAIFQPLFWTPLVVAFSLAFLAVTGWLLFGHGLAAATRNALYEPQLLLLVFGLTTLSAGFHELGHAAACRRSGARPGVMGVGLYLVWPAFYTDVTDSYRLDRRGRLRTDLGGIYFNAIFAVAAYGLWRLTGSEALLIVIPLQGLLMLRQLIPMVRLDGYHILADITGVPDLFAHIKPILKSMLPWNWGSRDAKALKPWVRVVVTAWVVLVIPILLFSLGLIVWTLPRILATAWDSVGLSWDELTTAVSNGETAVASLAGLSILALAIPALSMAYLVWRIARRTSTKVWRATEGRPVRRGLALLVAGALIGALVAAWWPHGQYEPIQETERGTIAALSNTPVATQGSVPLAAAEPTSLTLPVVAEDGTVGAPQTFELVDIGPNGEVLSSTVFDVVDERATFPFDMPDPPGLGDNQALVVNTVDGSSMIDLALSLVYIVDGQVVDNRNEAYAIASCIKCSTVAIAFQVVIIIDGAQIVIPENVAAAINYECAACVTQALAMQVLATTSEALTDAQMAELVAVWEKLIVLDKNAARMDLNVLYTELDAIQTEIEDLLVDWGAIEPMTDEGADVNEPLTSSFDDEPLEDEGAAPAPTTEPAAAEPEPEEPAAEPSPSSEPSESPSSEPSPSPSGSP